MTCQKETECVRSKECPIKDDWDVARCSAFKRKSEPMTNEEWFCSLSTEEKAKFLRQIYRDGRDDYVGEWYEQTEKDFYEWLKQPHTFE